MVIEQQYNEKEKMWERDIVSYTNNNQLSFSLTCEYIHFLDITMYIFPIGSILLFLILIVTGQSNDLFSNIGSARNNIGSLNQCVEIGNSRPCVSMPWNMTIFPNLLRHNRAEGKEKRSSWVFFLFLNISFQKWIMNLLCTFHSSTLIVQKYSNISYAVSIHRSVHHYRQVRLRFFVQILYVFSLQ